MTGATSSSSALTPDADEFARLARLSSVEYDRERQEAAIKLKIRVATLDREVECRREQQRGESNGTVAETDILADVEPSPYPVDGAALLSAIVEALERYIVLPDGGAVAIALWILL